MFTELNISPAKRARVYRFDFTCLVSRITGQVPYQDFTFPVSAFIGSYRHATRARSVRILHGQSKETMIFLKLAGFSLHDRRA